MINDFIQRLEELHGETVSTDSVKVGTVLKKLLKDVVAPVAFQAEVLPDGTELEMVLQATDIENSLNVSGWVGERSQFKKQLAECRVAIVVADYILCDTGTVVFLQPNQKSRLLTLLPEWLIVIIDTQKALANLPELYETIGVETTAPLLFTGPSRTADIEKQLVLGVHGPARLTAVLCSSV